VSRRQTQDLDTSFRFRVAQLSYRQTRTLVGYPEAQRGWLTTSANQFGLRNLFLSPDFKDFFTLFSKCFSTFPHGTCLLSVSCQYLALEAVYLPIRNAIPSILTLIRNSAREDGPGQTPSLALFSNKLYAPLALRLTTILLTKIFGSGFW